MASDFDKDLARGKVGEHIFAALYADKGAQLLHGKGADVLMCGEYIEVKTDYHDCDYTPNLYIEYMSVGNGYKIPASIWAAKEAGCTYLAYMFIHNRKMYIYDIDALLYHLDKYSLVNYREITTTSHRNNSMWQGIGYLVPRRDLVHALVDIVTWTVAEGDRYVRKN